MPPVADMWEDDKKGNLNWEISVLEAQTGKGKSMWKAKAMLAKQERVAAKRAKAAAGEETAQAEPQAAESKAEAAEERLRKLRVEKTRRKAHFVRGRAAVFMRRIVRLEKQRLLRKAKKARQRIKELKDVEGPDAERERCAAEKAISTSEADLKYVTPLPIADLAQCVMFRLLERCPQVKEIVDAVVLTPKAAEINADKRVQQHILGEAKTVKFIRDFTVDLDNALTGVDPHKMALERRRAKKAVVREERAAQKERELEAKRARAQEKKLARGLAKEDQPAADGSGDELMYVDRLGGHDSDVSISMSEDEPAPRAVTEAASKRATKAKKGRARDDYDEDDDDRFAEIYGEAGAKKNRPGQRARRKKYEEMYGDEANHVKLKRKPKKDEAVKRARKDAPGPGAKKPRRDTAGAGAGAGTGPAPQTQSVHPSWEAKRREKELLAKAKEVKGNRIVFD
ncbi:hypothetical protein H4R18_002382 [Coemansia javaensis]|uniref:Bud22 domain-containing protein n=1 Tax=Coemansia javaensis TaxID=2761396 RepID=A0A9W8HHQ9_9FUNG|nr:hypothetical protein H4R18_002382 [Coemansia javaensis]